MPIYTKGAAVLNEVPDLSSFETGYGDVIAAQAAAGFESSLGWTQAILRSPFAVSGGILQKDQAIKYITEAGFPKIEIPDEGIDRTKLDLMLERQRRMRSYNAISQAGGAGSGVVGFVGSMIGSMADPVNLAVGLVPIPFLDKALQARLALQSGTVARAVSRVGIGAAEGAIASTLIEPLNYQSLRALGDDYTMVDSLMSIGLGSLASGVLRGGAGFISDRLTKKAIGLDADITTKPEVATPDALKIDVDPANIVKTFRETLAQVPWRLTDVQAKGIENLLEGIGATSEPMQAIRAVEFVSRMQNEVEQLKAGLQGLNEILPDTEVSGITEAGTFSRWMFNQDVRESFWPKLDEDTKVAWQRLRETANDQTIVKEPSSVEAITIDDVMNNAPADQIRSIVDAATGAKASMADNTVPASTKLEQFAPEQRAEALKLAVAQMTETGTLDVEPIFRYLSGDIAEPEYRQMVGSSLRKTADFEPQPDIETVPGMERYARASDEDLDADIDTLEKDLAVKAKQFDESNTAVLMGESVTEVPTDAPRGKNAITTLIDDLEAKGNDVSLSRKFIDSMPDRYFENTGIQFVEGFNAQGQFNFINGIATIFSRAIKDGVLNEAVVHELWHSMSKYLDKKSARSLRKMFEKQKAAFDAANPDHPMNTLDTYRFRSFDEWFAESMLDRVKLEAMQPSPEKTIIGFARDVLGRILQSAKEILGFDEVGRVLKKFKRGKFKYDVVAKQIDDLARMDVEKQYLSAQQELARLTEETNNVFKISGAVMNYTGDIADLNQFRSFMFKEVPLANPDMVEIAFETFRNEYGRMLRSATLSGAEDSDVRTLAAREVQRSLDIKAKIKKRASLYTLMKRIETTQYVDSIANKREAILSLLSGSYGDFKGRFSVESIQRGYKHKFAGGFLADLRNDNLLDIFQSRQFDREIATALFHLQSDQAIPNSVPKEAGRIAEIVNKYQGIVRAELNKRGTWIRKLKGRIAFQSHDMMKIRGNFTPAAKQDWIAFVSPRIDPVRTFGTTDLKRVNAGLSAVYDSLASGDFMKANQVDVALQKSGYANQLNAHRELIFKGPNEYLDYNQSYGKGDLFTAIFGELTQSAEKVGVMEVLGPNHRRSFESLVNITKNKASKLNTEQFLALENTQRLFDVLDVVDGTANIPASAMVAKVGSILRLWQTLSKLGGMVISQGIDVVNAASELRYQGVGVFDRYWYPIKNTLKFFSRQKQQRLAEQFGLVSESMIGDLIQRFDDPTIGGMSSRSINWFMKVNGSAYVTDSMRRGVAFGMAKEFAQASAIAWNDLKPQQRRLFRKYGIEESGWDIIRQGKQAVEEYGDLITPEAVSQFNQELGEKYRQLVLDRVYTAVVEPDARTRSAATFGIKKGTIGGELIRFATQFKSFTAALFLQQYRRDFRAAGTRLDKFSGIAQTIAGMAVAGFVVANLKQIMKNREPLDPVKYPIKSVTAAMLQGGSLGIFGDFLFGQYNRFGGGIAETLIGPVSGEAVGLIELYQKLRAGQAEAGDFFNKALNNTPFLNLFYVRPVLNMLIFNRLQEYLNPGYFRRTEQRLRREEGRGFLIRPY